MNIFSRTKPSFVSYSKEFYKKIEDDSFASAKVIVPHLIKLFNPQSVVDLGCGTGTFLSVFRENNIKDILGLDLTPIHTALLRIPENQFCVTDLSLPLKLQRKFDLAISLEVAEHLPPNSACQFVENLVSLSDYICFSAAIPYQGGNQHINCQWPVYWKDLFEAKGYALYDVLRGLFWNNPNVDWWYAQNIMLFINKKVLTVNLELELSKCLQHAPLPLVHPKYYSQVMKEKIKRERYSIYLYPFFNMFRPILMHFQKLFLRVHSSKSQLNLKSKKSFQNGIMLVGCIKGELGLGEANRLLAKTFLTASIDFNIYNFSFRLPHRHLNADWDHYITKKPIYNINFITIPPAYLQEFNYKKLGSKFFRNRFNIGFWFWELSQFPARWRRAFDFIDEVWAPSKFMQESFANQAPCHVIHLPQPIDVEFQKLERNYFGLNKDDFIFFFNFDFYSNFYRKNPEALIRAFNLAFKNKDKNVKLVIKTIYPENYLMHYKNLHNLAATNENVIIINKMYNRQEMLSLINCCDCYISLHRTEGLGLTLAEAMLIGKPVIATAYSGNMDFMKESNSCLVDFKLIPVGKGEYSDVESQVWADPNIEHAAFYMQKILWDTDYAKQLGLRAKQYINENYNLQIVGKKYRERLEKLGLLVKENT